MPDPVISSDFKFFLEQREFLHVGTCSPDAVPRVSPKFLVKVTDRHIYLADYVIGQVVQNLKANPRVSLATIDKDKLIGYQINGTAKIMDHGPEYDAITKDFRDKAMEHLVTRFIEGVRQKKKLQDFETAFPELFVIFKVSVEEIVKIGPTGSLERKKTLDYNI